MRIAQVAPLYESVPPRLYGGTERVVSHLTEELVRRGHDVTLFATGDSVTSARLVATVPRALRLDRACRDPLAPHVLQLEQVARRASAFDVVHFHCDYLHFPLTRRVGWPSVTTLHGRLDLPELPAVFGEYREMPLVSISEAQRAPLPAARWLRTIHHGLPLGLYPFHPGGGGYFAFLGRFSPEKRVDRAIEIARRAGLPLRIAAKVDPADQEYYQSIRPLLDAPGVEVVGEIGDDEKPTFLGEAAALLFPIDWPEPFGLAVIEAMACGTPVVAFRLGSMPEIVDEGVTGFLVDDVDAGVAAAGRAAALDRRRVREVFEARFSVEGMAAEYLDVYERVARAGRAGAHAADRRAPARPRPAAARVADDVPAVPAVVGPGAGDWE